MNDLVLSQIGLAVVYGTMGGLVLLIDRVERSAALRAWGVAFALFAADAATATAIGLRWAPATFAGLSQLFLIAGATLCLVGSLKLAGRRASVGVWVLLGAGVAFASLRLFADIALESAAFLCVGAALTWGGLAVRGAGVPGGIGHRVAAVGFFLAASYAVAWPFMRDFPFALRLEFYFDLGVVLLGASGVLLIHFEQSRERVRQAVAQQLKLQQQLELAERIEALGRLAAGVAHDFNNVVATVVSGSELVLRQIEDRPRAAAQLRLVLDAARGSAATTRQLLALGRQRMPKRVPVLVAPAVRAALGVIKASIDEKVRLEVDLPEEPLGTAAGEGQLEQLVTNLGKNALEAMPAGGVLRIVVRPVTSRPNHLHLVVSDTGEGILPEVLPHIWEPFFTTKAQHGGSGIGLAAVHALVRQLGGSITVDSAPGKGSAFIVELERCEPPEVVTPPRRVPSRGKRVVVVDDSEGVLQAMTGTLEEAGLEVIPVASAEAALAEIEQRRPALVLTDHSMPGMSGLELRSALALRHPELPVVLMSAFDPPSTGEAAEAGDFLAKPFSNTQLIEAIEHALGRPSRQLTERGAPGVSALRDLG